ncbi:hypothetical protein HK102_006073 [Quaeritorhiza haematococci]|nr:hypothetical protein HK102_006073 [Quaeritorhiza haematococci]
MQRASTEVRRARRNCGGLFVMETTTNNDEGCSCTDSASFSDSASESTNSISSTPTLFIRIDSPPRSSSLSRYSASSISDGGVVESSEGVVGEERQENIETFYQAIMDAINADGKRGSTAACTLSSSESLTPPIIAAPERTSSRLAYLEFPEELSSVSDSVSDSSSVSSAELTSSQPQHQRNRSLPKIDTNVAGANTKLSDPSSASEILSKFFGVKVVSVSSTPSQSDCSSSACPDLTICCESPISPTSPMSPMTPISPTSPTSPTAVSEESQISTARRLLREADFDEIIELGFCRHDPALARKLRAAGRIDSQYFTIKLTLTPQLAC